MREHYQAIVITAGMLALGALGLLLSSCGVGTNNGRDTTSQSNLTATQQVAATVPVIPFHYVSPQVSPARMATASMKVVADPFAGAEKPRVDDKTKTPVPPPHINAFTIPACAPYVERSGTTQQRSRSIMPLGHYAGWIFNNHTGRLCAIYEDPTGMQRTVSIGDDIENLRVTAITADTLQLTDETTGEMRTLKLRQEF